MLRGGKNEFYRCKGRKFTTNKFNKNSTERIEITPKNVLHPSSSLLPFPISLKCLVKKKANEKNYIFLHNFP